MAFRFERDILSYSFMILEDPMRSQYSVLSDFPQLFGEITVHLSACPSKLLMF